MAVRTELEDSASRDDPDRPPARLVLDDGIVIETLYWARKRKQRV